MRAVVIRDFGVEPELADLPVPEPGAGEIRVLMRAAGMNPFDWKVIDGALKGVVEHPFPLVMGSDGAGEVDAVGAGVDAFSVGDRVFGQFMKVALGRGSYAEQVLAPADGKLAPMPEGLSFETAAALPTGRLNLDIGFLLRVVGWCAPHHRPLQVPSSMGLWSQWGGPVVPFSVPTFTNGI